MSTDDLVTAADARTSIDLARGHLADAGKEIVWQVRNKVWHVLGYSDWDEMREAEYGGAAVIVPSADRPELSAALYDEGLTPKQVGATFGVSDRTVDRDVRQMSNVPPTRPDSLGRQQPTSKPRPRTPGAETRPREDHSAPGPTDSDATSPAPDAAHDPIGDAKAEARNAPARIGSAVMLDLEKAHGHIVRAGGPAAICADNEDLGAAFNPPLWADTLDRLIPLLTEWRRQLRRTHLRGVK